MPHSLQSGLLHLSYNAKLGGHVDESKLFLTLRKAFYRPSMAVDCYTTGRFRTECLKNRVRLRRNAKKTNSFSARAPFEFFEVDVLGPLLINKRGKKFLLLITYHCSNLVQTVSLGRITTLTMTQALVTHWIFVYGSPMEVLSDNKTQLASKVLQDVFRILDVKNVFMTTYRPQYNGQFERFNGTLLASLCSYIAHNLKIWELYTDASTFAYSTHAHRNTGISPFELLLSRSPPLMALNSQSTLYNITSVGRYLQEWKQWLTKLFPAVRTSME